MKDLVSRVDEEMSRYGLDRAESRCFQERVSVPTIDICFVGLKTTSRFLKA